MTPAAEPDAARAAARHPSPFFERHAGDLARAARLGPVADLACGRGRHALPGAAQGLPMIAVDRNLEFLCALRETARQRGLSIAALQADLEGSDGIPLRSHSCGAILVFRFLFRPLAPAIEAALAPGGLLLYETFTRARAHPGVGPRNPEFLLEPGELRSLFPGLEILAYEEGTRGGDFPEAHASLAAVAAAQAR